LTSLQLHRDTSGLVTLFNTGTASLEVSLWVTIGNIAGKEFCVVRFVFVFLGGFEDI